MIGKNILDSFLGTSKAPQAKAVIKGSAIEPQIAGLIGFYPVPNGTIVKVEINGLPKYQPAIANMSPIGPFGFHIHSGSTCGLGDGKNPFEASGGHYNPDNQPHGNHAGDMPVLFSNDGYASMIFFTNRFKPSDVIGKTVIIHQNPDDFRTQPSGASGPRIACGVIEKV
jgi:Cu-Zn family superoxide dismutase